MPNIIIFPLEWYESLDWSYVQVIGKTDFNKSISLNIKFDPYVTIRHINKYEHEYIVNNMNCMKNKKIDNDIYRYYFNNKYDYEDFIALYSIYGSGEIIDLNQGILSKFFCDKRILPCNWLVVNMVKPISANISSSKSQNKDLQFFIEEISNVELNNEPIIIDMFVHENSVLLDNNLHDINDIEN